MNREEVRNRLLNGAEESFKEFNKKLIPGVETVIGVRMPYLKELAKEMVKLGAVGFIEELERVEQANGKVPKELQQEIYYEERMLRGLIIGGLKLPEEERLRYIKEFVPSIDNWAVCDCVCGGLKAVKKAPELYWDFVVGYLNSTEEFELRFAVVILMSYFVEDTHIDQVLDILQNIKHEGYYVKMGVAWALSVCYIKYPEKTRVIFEDKACVLDDFTFNKAIQKIRESYRVSKEDKEYLNSLKRKKK